MELSSVISLINTASFQFGRIIKCTDLGAGSGIFTYALSTLLQSGSEILAVDYNISTLHKIKTIPTVKLEIICADFIKDKLPLTDIDLVMMANSLHFVKDKISFIEKLSGYMAAHGSLFLVEYDLDKPNQWVPYPLRIDDYQKIFLEMGYTRFEIINTVPSKFRRADIVGIHIAR